MSGEEYMEFMDIDGPEFISDVNSQIASIRADVEMTDYQSTSATAVSQASIQPWDIEAFAEVAVLDTNFLLSKLGYLDTVLDLANANPGSLLVVLPWIVIQELDSLKSRASESVKSSVRMAMRFIEIRLLQKMTSLRGQQMDQVYDKYLESSKRNSNVKGDDRILDCCLYFNKVNRKPVTLLSNDRNLCIKAMIHQIDTVSAESVPKLESLLNKLLSSKPFTKKTAPTSSSAVTPTITLYDQPKTVDLSLYDDPPTINIPLSSLMSSSQRQEAQQQSPSTIEDYSMDVDDDDSHFYTSNSQQRTLHNSSTTTNSSTINAVEDIDWLRNAKGTAYSKWATTSVPTYDPYVRKTHYFDDGPACLDNDPTLTAPKRPYRPNHVSRFDSRH
ncbi:PIN domain-containing protein [Mycotypha africana]|uniref:PIN domain-containing protein n=1 Tax=Mycotypha africana TaxID=64632 RepID=UPI002301736B|nr:PIN domain-containing protein [Mycotypha africana]KAI8975042.1 PIN domain-containing protein [Mycotypha africana]